MTASANSAPEAARPRTLQDELLQDLRQTAPMHDPRPGPSRPRAKQAPLATAAISPAVELRVTRNRWLAPSMRLASQGVALSAGPISVSVGFTDR
jgi:hypothetical protein